MRLALPALAALMIAAPAASAPAPKWQGVWKNAANSVQIRTSPCGRGGLCGTVIWANAKAKADVAARGGKLIGAQLFRNFEQVDANVWEGDVYVPDLDRTVSGTVTFRGANTLVGEGCLFGRLGCKAQVWTRVPGKK